jgi:hypothetical protein
VSLQPLVAAIRRAASVGRDSATSPFVRHGAAVVHDGSGAGWYRIESRLSAGELDRLGDAVLAPHEGPDERRYTVIAADPGDGALLVQV